MLIENGQAERPWHYVLLGECLFAEWREKGARLPALLNFARVRPLATSVSQGQLKL
ncbi:MAG: hypothetical protein ACD_10C00614G0001 [uncultured bacterium]|nr:MAG: hypothetical protein ACD_10C00614G0001 [uncultured bacterium]